MLRVALPVAVLVTPVLLLGVGLGMLAAGRGGAPDVERAVADAFDDRFDDAFDRALEDALDGRLGRELDDRIEEQAAGADDDFLFELGVGDCLDDVLDTQVVDEQDAIPCEEPHDLEVYAALELPDGEYPGEEIFEQADLRCVEEFERFTGESYEESPLDFLSITPNEEGWDAGDHEVVCILFDVAGERLTGSARGRPT